MSEKKPNTIKALAILALPMGTSVGIGTMLGSVAGNIPIGICLGIMGGSVIGLIAFIVLLLSSKKKDK